MAKLEPADEPRCDYIRDSALSTRVSRLRLLRFLIIGAANTLLYGALSLTFVYVLQISAQAAAILAYAVSLPVSFVSQKQLVFSPKSRFRGKQLARFLSMHAGNLALTYIVVSILVDALGVSRETAVIANCLVIAGVSYAAMKMWVFAQQGVTK